MASTYVDNAVPFGSFAVDLIRAGTTLGTYVLEDLTVTRPTKVIERPDATGGPNGWAAVPAQVSASGTIQIPTSDGDYPDLGDYFERDFGYGTERYVLTEVGIPFRISDYYKANFKAMHSPNPPA
jgi:hypothetical protein